MDSTRHSFWQLTAIIALFPIAGLWPTMLGSTLASPTTQAASDVPAAQVAEQPAQIFPLPQVAQYEVKRTVRLTVTAYTSSVDETDNSPFITASGTRVRDGIIAQNSLPFGTRVRFPDAFGDKVFVVEDRLSSRKGTYIADIWMPTKTDAQTWGARVLTMEILDN